jgi:hypothetical protein
MSFAPGTGLDRCICSDPVVPATYRLTSLVLLPPGFVWRIGDLRHTARIDSKYWIALRFLVVVRYRL